MKATKRTSERAQRLGDAMERREHRDGARRSFQRAARESRAKRSDGLVVAAYLSVSRKARLVQLHLPGIAPAEMPTRGECEGMSEDSQRRLLNMLHQLRRDAALPVMVTLTFPAELTVTPAEAKACRLAWEKRMRRRYGPAWCNVWRLEAHPEMSARLGRVHPHFHLLTWGAWYDFSEVSVTWNEVVWEVLQVDKGMVDVRVKHILAGTSCERIRQWGGVLYSAKNYIAKAEEYPLGKAGRVWGWHNRKALPLDIVERIPLTCAEAVSVRLAVEEWMRERRIVSEHLVCTFYDDDPGMFAARLMARFNPPQLPI